MDNANDAEGQITIKTPDGTKQTAPLTPNQKIGFPQLEAGGGTVVGKGKCIFTGGFEIPAGTKVEIIRPPK